jgi:hypothetical protein
LWDYSTQVGKCLNPLDVTFGCVELFWAVNVQTDGFGFGEVDAKSNCGSCLFKSAQHLLSLLDAATEKYDVISIGKE